MKKIRQNNSKCFYYFSANFSVNKYERIKLLKIFNYKNFKCMCTYS